MELFHIFNGLYSDRESLSQSTVSKVLHYFNETDKVEEKPRIGKPKSSTSDETSLNI